MFDLDKIVDDVQPTDEMEDVVMGLIILCWTNYGMKKKNSDTGIEDIEACAAFWHMCDLIWLLLFPVLYLIF